MVESSQAHQAPSYVIVSQVKSNRIVYFTDDLDYQPPMEGDWYYVSSYSGALPEKMTLRNCWGWRFNGGVFSDARETPKSSSAETLLTNNRRALQRILREKIDAVRKPFLASCAHGDVVRRIKLREAKAFMGGTGEGPHGVACKMLEAVAVARNSSVIEAARLILAKAEETERVLLESERFREQMSEAITGAKDEKTLGALREWLLDKVYPELTEEFKYRIENTDPIDLDALILDHHRHHEIARLRVSLREAINRQREPLRSGYLGNDEIRRHKAMLAQSLLENGGTPCSGVDYSVLEAYATARSLPFAEAAELLLNSIVAGRDVLARTERIKDQLLARIDVLKTLRDIREIEALIKQIHA